jgi:DNA polymerase-4
VGKKAQAALSAMGIETIGQLAAYPKEVLASRFGELGDHLWHLSRGIDDREVVPERAPKSIGHENTFDSDLEDPEELAQIVLEQADRVAHRLRKHGYLARTVVLKVKTHDFQLLTRRRSLPRATCDGGVLGRIAGELLAKLLRKKGALKLRLTGVAAADLEPAQAPRQLTFDEPEHEQQERLAEVMDTITDRFGRDTLMRASTLDRRKKRD